MNDHSIEKLREYVGLLPHDLTDIAYEAVDALMHKVGKMNKQRKVLITITYNEMGIIIDTKAEEVAQPNLQPTCNNLATDCISRQAAIYAFGLSEKTRKYGGDHSGYDTRMLYEIQDVLEGLPSAQPDDRLAKIADLVEGTIDHFDLDDAMDLLYQIKEVLK